MPSQPRLQALDKILSRPAATTDDDDPHWGPRPAAGNSCNQPALNSWQ